MASPEPSTAESDTGISILRSRIASAAVGSALFMQFVDSSALAIALPTLAREFGSDPIDLRLVLTTYMVVQALFLPACGWVADRYGARRVFMGAMLVFLAGSILSGLSQTLPQLVASRAVQGLGGSMMLPVGRIIVVGCSPRSQLVQAMTWLSMPAMLGPLLGPPLAGVILQFASWPWIFFVNIPIGLLSLAAVLRFVPRLEQPHPGGFDAIGFLLAMLAIGAVMTVAEASGHSGRLQLAAAAAILPAGLLYVLHARRRTRRGGRPVLDFALLRHQTLRASVLGGALVRLGMGGTPYLMALLLQFGLGYTPLQAGALTIAMAAGSFLARPLGPTVIRRVGFRTMLIASAVAVGLFSAAPALFTSQTAGGVIVVVLALSGLVRTAQFSAVNSLAFSNMPSEQVSAAAAIAAVVQQISLSLGVSLAAVSLAMAQGAGPLQAADFAVPFILIGVLSVASAAIYARLPVNAGADISGRRLR